MRVAIGSAWRSSERNIKRYFDQVFGLAQLLEWEDHFLRIIAIEGDSRDNTHAKLIEAAASRMLDLDLVKFNQNTPQWGSTEQPERMSALSDVLNKCVETVRFTDDIFVYVESDLIWDPHTLKNGIDKIKRHEEGVDILAVMPFAGKMFYDVWAFRKNGTRFHGVQPYHPEFNPSGYTVLDSAGSCVIMEAYVARQVRVRNGNAFVGWCEDARRQMFKIATHSDLWVTHPA